MVRKNVGKRTHKSHDMAWSTKAYLEKGSKGRSAPLMSEGRQGRGSLRSLPKASISHRTHKSRSWALCKAGPWYPREGEVSNPRTDRTDPRAIWLLDAGIIVNDQSWPQKDSFEWKPGSHPNEPVCNLKWTSHARPQWQRSDPVQTLLL